MSRSRSTRNFTSLSAHPYVGFESHKKCRLQQFNIMVKNFYRDVPEKVSEKFFFQILSKMQKKPRKHVLQLFVLQACNLGSAYQNNPNDIENKTA